MCEKTRQGKDPPRRAAVGDPPTTESEPLAVLRDGEMAKCLGAIAALPEDTSAVPASIPGGSNHIELCLRVLKVLFWLLWSPPQNKCVLYSQLLSVCVHTYIHTYIQTYIHI